MQHSVEVVCSNCGRRLRLPENLGTLEVRCRGCNYRFLWNPQKGVQGQLYKTTPQTPGAKNNRATRLTIITVAIVALIVFIYLIIPKGHEIGQKMGVVPEQKWLSVSYGQLVDMSEITHSGQTLHQVLADPNLRSEAQPHVDRYSFLLQYAVEMLRGPDSLPYHNIIDHYPVGSRQPAWVALLRGGRICVTTNNKDNVRVFLLGTDPALAYEKNYTIIRHCLSGLLPDDDSIKVEVFAYENNYGSCELRINLHPYSFAANKLPTPSGKVAIDVTGLKKFFEAGGELIGAELDREEGLILYAEKGQKQTLNGQQVTLADLAVAYRAVFHAGDNQAYVSLDRHKDPTKVKVNFGGFLEDTRIGSVVLEADKRFKTIGCGFDPNSHKDIRRLTRASVPTFLTKSEKALMAGELLGGERWIGTRYWFYPESIEVKTDIGRHYARITRPQFRADAERDREDFASLEEFETKKKTLLPACVRTSIDHLNRYYSQYAEVYPEIKELTVVARLMGICTWLQRVNLKWLDLDAFLSVELPPFETEREKTQLLAVSYVTYTHRDELDHNYIMRNTKVAYLSPVLDKTLKQHFRNGTQFAKYLCHKNGLDEDSYRVYLDEANRLMALNGNQVIRTIIKSKEELKSLASYAAGQIDMPLPPVARDYEQRIGQLERAINKIKRQMQNLDSWEYNKSVDRHNDLVQQYNTLAARYEALDIQAPYVVEVGGGINLEPQYFSIKDNLAGYELQRFKEITEKTGTSWTEVNRKSFIRNDTKTDGSPQRYSLPIFNWVEKDAGGENGRRYSYRQSGVQQNYWLERDNRGQWRDLLELEKSCYRERIFDPTKRKIDVAVFRSNKIESYIVGTIVHEGRIEFAEADREDLLEPSEPPIWWQEGN